MTILATRVGRLGDRNWTFRSLWISVLGRGFLLASQLCKSVLERLWTLLKCVPKQLNTDNRLHDLRSLAVLGVMLHFCRPNVSTPVVQTSNCCRPNVQPVSPKWSSQKNLSPKRLLPKHLVAQMSVHQLLDRQEGLMVFCIIYDCQCLLVDGFLLCFDAIDWLTGRASGL